MNTLQENKTTTNPRRLESRFLAPAVDIRETREEYQLLADMPGVSKDDIEVVMDGAELTVTGHRRSAAVKGDYLHRESKEYSFRRTFEIDPSINSARIAAKMVNGVLTVHLPKAEAVKPRKIDIEG